MLPPTTTAITCSGTGSVQLSAKSKPDLDCLHITNCPIGASRTAIMRNLAGQDAKTATGANRLRMHRIRTNRNEYTFSEACQIAGISEESAIR